jgi:DNA-binding MarR family transcriptional regulator
VADKAQQTGSEEQRSIADQETDGFGTTRFIVESNAEPIRLIAAKAWQRASAARRKLFGDGDRMFADPAWEILIDLYVQHCEGRPVAITDACFASKVPATTALRWIDRLCDSGLITRIDDSEDARRTHIFLTEDALSKIDAALDLAIEAAETISTNNSDF